MRLQFLVPSCFIPDMDDDADGSPPLLRSVSDSGQPMYIKVVKPWNDLAQSANAHPAISSTWSTGAV